MKKFLLTTFALVVLSGCAHKQQTADEIFNKVSIKFYNRKIELFVRIFTQTISLNVQKCYVKVDTL